MTRLAPLLLACLLTFCQVVGWTQNANPAAKSASLAAADRLYQSGDFHGATERYQAILKDDSGSAPALSGLIRSLLREEKIDDALAVANHAITIHPDSASVLSAMGDVQFRFGRMSDAETSYLKALKFDSKQIPAYLGLARIYRAYSLYGHAYQNLERAHMIAPDDPEVERMWFSQLSRKERIAAMEAYLAAPHPDDAEDTGHLQRYLAFLKASEDQSHACKLVSKVEKTDTKLELLRRDPQHVFGVGLVVKLNGRDARLQLDTGADGITVGRKTAEKSGLKSIAEERYYGIGDKGVQAGYTTIADDIRVGDLEFQDCVVHVTNSATVTDENGLIGADVFSSYLIDIDMPDQKLRLSPLPKRPEESSPPTALKTEEQSDSGGDDNSADSSDTKKQDADAKPQTAEPAKPRWHPPLDRYVAPEMANWTIVFRFGSHLLIPTRINDSHSMLFLIDTGASVNFLSNRAATQVTKISGDPYVTVKGLNGSVSKVYRADKANLTFGHYMQKNQDMVTFDMSNLSRHMGTEVAGTLGFAMLHMLQLKIDYRDGLVDFVYDSKRWDH